MITCTRCGSDIHPLEVFPKNYCLDCHAATTPMVTGQELVAMWTGDSVIKPLSK